MFKKRVGSTVLGMLMALTASNAHAGKFSDFIDGLKGNMADGLQFFLWACVVVGVVIVAIGINKVRNKQGDPEERNKNLLVGALLCSISGVVLILADFGSAGNDRDTESIQDLLKKGSGFVEPMPTFGRYVDLTKVA